MARPLAADPRPSAALKFLACVVDEVTRETVKSVVAELGWQNAKVREGGAAAAHKFIETAGAAPTLLLVDVSDSEDPIRAMDEIAELCTAETRVVAIGVINDIGLYRRLTEMGVSDYLVKPVAGEALAEAILRADRRGQPELEPERAKTARLVALIGARGGVGTTTLAVSAGWTMAHEQRRRVVLVDLDLHFGNVALSLDLDPGRGLREILAHPERIDTLLISSAMSSESERLRILAAEEPLDEELELEPPALDPLMAVLGGDADCIVVDVPRRLDGMGRSIIGMADGIGIVTELTLSGMRDTQRMLTLVKGMRTDTKPLVIANRIGATPGEIGHADFERGIGTKIDHAIPYDAKAAAAVAERAKALGAVVRSSKTAAELRRLATALSGSSAVAAKPSLVKRLFG